MSGRILIVDDVATNRIVMRVKLATAQYTTLLAENGEDAIKIAKREQPDLVLLDVNMPDISGLEVCRRLKQDPQTAGIKIILVTVTADANARMRGLEAGADDFVTRPVDEVALLARVRSLLRARVKERELNLQETTIAELGFMDTAAQFELRQSVMLVTRTAKVGAAWAERLSRYMRETLVQGTADEVLRLTSDDPVPDLFVIDVDQGGRNGGLRLMSDLRSRAATRRSAIIIVLPQHDSERAATALDLGANDISYDPFLAPELAVRIRTQMSRKLRADRLRATLDDGLRMAVTDPLTGLYNRRYGMRHMERVARRCRDTGAEAAAILIDIDYFKAVNDAYGHLVGDRVLAKVAEALRDKLRTEDLLTRLGGEEFLVVMPETGLTQARLVAERLRRAVEALEVFPKPDSVTPIKVTLSLGIAMMSSKEHDITHILETVDRALYEAKAAGRNLVVIA